MFVGLLRPLPFPEVLHKQAIVKAIGFAPSIQDAKRNLEARKRRYLERKRCRSVVTRSANG